MNGSAISSWGRVLWAPHHHAALHTRHVCLASGAVERSVGDGLKNGTDAAPTMLPYGNGRSYGDSNLNPGGILLDTRWMNRFIAFDASTGVLSCEAGVLLSDILRLCVPQGWFPSVTPGTRFVTVGGAIANDVHGKNHHRAGSFGNHVLQFELLRSDGSRLVCSPDRNADWFAATIGGLGLTGLISWAQIQLQRIAGPFIDSETVRFRSLDEFFELSRASEHGWDYTVSWIDCASAGRRLGRGLFSRGNHAPAGAGAVEAPTSLTDEPRRRVPFTPPISLINGLTLKAFNWAYFHRQRDDHVRARQHYAPFFYPLDAVLEWNRIYGPRGFYQYQCVVPDADALRSVRRLLETIAVSGMGSFLAVLKQFGAAASRGMLSFPMPGTTLALDFPNRGERPAPAVRCARSHRARCRRTLVPRQGRPHGTGDLQGGLSALARVQRLRRSTLLVRVLAARHGCAATGMKHILIVGATSAIAEACARRWALRGDRLFLAARNAAQLQSIADDLRVRGAPHVDSRLFDAIRFDDHEALLVEARERLGGLDTVLIAHGSLPDQRRAQVDVAYALEEIGTNGLSVVALMTLVANQFEQQGYGTLAVISSVAGDRGRQSNYVYGCAKSMVSAFASGLRQRLDGRGVRVVTIEPGFVDTPLTAHIPKNVLWATPDRVAIDIVRAIGNGQRVLYTPGFWRIVMGVIRHIPEFVFIRLKL